MSKENKMEAIKGTKSVPSRRTYQSSERDYELRPDKLFELIGDISLYFFHNAGAIPTFGGEGNRLKIETLCLPPANPGMQGFCDLAELIVDTEKRSLIMHIYPHPDVFLNSQVLEAYAKKYLRK